MNEALEKDNLAQRTRGRNELNWMSMNFAGFLDSVQDLEDEHNRLAKPLIESYIDVSDALYGIKEYQRGKTHELSQEEVAQEELLANLKSATTRAKLAIQHTTSEYVLTVQRYDAKVRAQLMGVKEYAALVERQMLAAEKAQAGLAVDKEALHLAKVEADIYLQYIERAQVEADIAKAQVEVAKANVRAAEAGIAAGEAEIKLIEAQTQQFVMQAEKATLQAEVAMIFADIMTKQLAKVKLDVGQKEITAGFGYIQTRLDDMIALYDTKTLIEQTKADAEWAILPEVAKTAAAATEEEYLKGVDLDVALDVQAYDKTQTTQNIADEKVLRATVLKVKKLLDDERVTMQMDRDTKQTWAEALVNAAQRWYYVNQVRVTSSMETKKATEELTISAGTA